MKKEKHKVLGGFTLIELVVYIAIFGATAGFLVGIFAGVTKSQLRQASTNEVNQQIAFVADVIKRLVRDSSVVENPAGVASTTLLLRMSSSALDPTKVYSSGTVLYLAQGTSTPIALTTSKVNVANFSVVKYENPGAGAIVQTELALDYVTLNEQEKFSRVWRSAFTRISAATFDSSVLPNSDASFDIGGASSRWRDAFLSGKLTVLGNAGFGTSTSALSTMKLNVWGDIGVSTSTYGLVLKAPNGSCFRIGVNNSGNVTTSSATCP